jgi:hypothetical protein
MNYQESTQNFFRTPSFPPQMLEQLYESENESKLSESSVLKNLEAIPRLRNEDLIDRFSSLGIEEMDEFKQLSMASFEENIKE